MKRGAAIYGYAFSLFMSAEHVGYASHVFQGKQEQMLKVSKCVLEKRFIPQDLVDNEVSWFYQNLGIDDMYFQQEAVETIAQHMY